MPAGDEDAPALIDALAARAVEATPAVWDDEAVDWSRFDLVVVRSTWDYPARHEEFLAWADSLPRVLNPSSVLSWNTDKRYLSTLGPEVVPTVFLEAGYPFHPPSAPFVVKPAVGAGSIGAARYEAEDDRAAEHVAALHSAGKTVMVQPYVEEVDREGEIAILYMGGRFSHAVRKGPLLEPGTGPGAGLYVEERITAADPTPEEVDLADRALASLPFDARELLYARVDLLPGPLVLEIELTEPSLFLGYVEGATDRFADAVAEAMG